jgi:hypothetical protein
LKGAVSIWLWRGAKGATIRPARAVSTWARKVATFTTMVNLQKASREERKYIRFFFA